MMFVNTLVLRITILFSLPFIRGVTATTGNSDLRGIVRDVVKEILSDANSRTDSEEIFRAAIDVDELKNKSNFLEQKVLSLERQNEEKDSIIRSLQRHVYELLESDLRTGNVMNGTENEANDPASANIADNHPGAKSLTRKRRQIAVPNIAFSAFLTRTQSNMSPGQTIKFDHILLNDGHGYNSYTGVFTAPISGTYLFTFHFDSRVHTFVRLNYDGVNIVDAVANPHTTNAKDRETMGGNTVAMHIGIGQAVSVEVYAVSGEAASSDTYRLSTFSGFLLYPEHI